MFDSPFTGLVPSGTTHTFLGLDLICTFLAKLQTFQTFCSHGKPGSVHESLCGVGMGSSSFSQLKMDVRLWQLAVFFISKISDLVLCVIISISPKAPL